MRKCIFAFFFVLFFNYLGLAQSETANLVSLKPEVIVSKDKLNLGDIANISVSEKKVALALESLSLGYSPQIGLVREISKEKVRLAIASLGLGLNQIQLDMPESITIRRASQEIDLEFLVQEIEKVTLKDLESNGASARITKLDLPTQITVPAGDLEVSVNVPSVKNIFAPFIILVEIRVDKVLTRRLSLNCEIEAYATVVVTQKNLKAGAPLRVEDLSLEAIKLKVPLNQYVRDLSTLRGLAFAKNMSKGEALLSANITPSIVIKQGDLVEVLSQSSKLSIQAKALAVTSGRIGDKIKLKSSFSDTLFDAIVIDEGLAKVSFEP